MFNTKYGNTEKKFVPIPKLNRVKNGLKTCYLRIKYGFSVFNTKYGFSVFNTKYGNTEKKFVPTPKLNRVKDGLKTCYLRIKYGFFVFNTK